MIDTTSSRVQPDDCLPPLSGGGALDGRAEVATLAVAVTAFLLLLDAFSGTARYYLAAAGLEFLVYLPKGLCLLFVCHQLMRRHVDRLLLGTVLALCFFVALGFLNQVPPLVQVFSLLMVIPMLFGLSAGRYLLLRERALVWLLSALFMVTALGVYLDLLWQLPWEGFTYRIEGAEVEGSRDWSTFGLARRAGFTRMSASASFYLVCSILFLLNYLRHWTYKAALLLVGVPALLLTTNKAGILALLLGILASAVARIAICRKACLYGLALIVAVFPFSILFHRYDLSLSDPVSLLLLASFEDRLINTWPSFIEMVGKIGHPLTGVGFGGVGSGLKYFNGAGREALAFADNFALYLYGLFGPVALFIICYLARLTDRLFTARSALCRSLAPVMVALLAASLTTDVVESQVFALFLGVAVACLRHDQTPQE